MKILPCGVAVVEGDTHIGKWVEQEGRLDIARNMIEPFKPWIPKGGVVVDAGASIGDHTVTYAKLVGKDGEVWAFEPDPESYQCLVHNTINFLQVMPHNFGLGRDRGKFHIMRGENSGASWMIPRTEDSGDYDAIAFTLDSLQMERLDFMKIDVEGMECGVLEGATETINRFHPAILCEVNEGALLRAGSSRPNLIDKIEELGYMYQITDNRMSYLDPQYDIFCTYKI